MSDQPRPLSTGEAAEILRATGAALAEELQGLPEALLNWQPGPDEWCIKEALGHLIESEGHGFAGRMRAILAQHEPQFSAWDPPAVARARRDHQRDLAELLEEFGHLRTASVALVAGLSDADLARGGQHPVVGYLRVSDLLHEWIHHDRTHIRQMHAAAQAYVWPHMGNAQRFSSPT